MRRFQFVGLEVLYFEVTHLVLATLWLSHCGCRGCRIVVVMEPSCDVDLVDGDLVGGLVIKQPGDNSCLYHSLYFFLNRMYQTSSYTLRLLRAEIIDLYFLIHLRCSTLGLDLYIQSMSALLWSTTVLNATSTLCLRLRLGVV